MDYTSKCISQASLIGKVDILQWWKDSDLEMKYDEDAFTHAVRYKKIDTVKWWKDSGLEIKK